MAEINDTSSTTDDADEVGNSPLTGMALDLNNFGALLKGVGEICKAEDIGGDALYVAAVTCDQINAAICRMADRLDAMATEGGAA